MISMTVAEMASLLGAEVINLDASHIVTEYPVIDSRSATPGTFFVALPGENRDGNDFIESAIENGASFAITNRETAFPSFLVEDAHSAISTLARATRSLADNCTFIGITGSQGKTTTKELLGHILSTSGETVVPAGSFNNEIGMPLTILRCTDRTKYCVLEMGARHKGDIASLCTIAQPSVGAVLVVGSAHLGEFGDRTEIAATKRELIDSLQAGGIAILGDYDEYTPKMGEGRSDIERIVFGENSHDQVRAADMEIREGYAHFDLVTPAGRSAVSLRVLGAHQVANALAAAAIATALGLSIESIAAALSTAEIHSKWRMELHDLGEYLVINDSYNANPESMSAALRTLSLFAQERGGSSWAFLGKMHELGASEPSSHQAIGRLAAQLGIDHLVAVGTDLYGHEFEDLSLHICPTMEAALDMAGNIEAGDSVLVKASRAEHLELLAEKIINALSSRNLGESQ